MNYKRYIEENFLIDEPKAGKLVPFTFNKVQNEYYQILKDLGIEQGINQAIREFIVKARREGFSSLILGIFAADDLTSPNPTETMVMSYKDDATNTFRKRYRRFILSAAAKKAGLTVDDIQRDINSLEQFKRVFSIDSSDLELAHNRAHFLCGTAAARTGGRGGVLQKLLFTEAAHYQDTEHMTAKEIIEGTSQQVDKASGWIFHESTANGVGNYFHTMYEEITKGLMRFLLRFFGWKSYYTEEQFTVIRSEFADKDMLKQEYPETIEEAFLASNLSFTNKDEILAQVGVRSEKRINTWVEFAGVNYIDQCESILDFLVILERNNPNRAFYVGLDTAKSIDRTIVCVLELTELTTHGGVVCMAIDSTGQGDFIPDWFEKNCRWHIHRMKFSRPTKSIMYKNLQSVMKSKGTSLPEFVFNGEFISDEWKHFYTQMLNLQKQIIGELLVVAHPNGKCKIEGGHDYDNCKFHDDYPDSWALAETAYIALNGLPEANKPPPKPQSNLDGSVRRLLVNKGKGNGSGIENMD